MSTPPVANVFLLIGRLLAIGGVEQYVSGLGAALAEQGVRVTVFSWRRTASPNPTLDHLRQVGVSWVQPPAWWGLWLRVSRPKANRTALHFAYAIRQMERAAAQCPPEVIHAHRVDALPLLRQAFLRRYPLVYTEHGLPAPEWEDFSAEVNLAQAVVAVSPAGKAALERVWGCRAPVTVIYPIVAAPAQPPPLSEAPSELRLGYLGRLDENKNVTGILDAFARLDPALAVLEIWGDGPSRAGLQEQARRLGLGERVQFCGPYRPQQLTGLMERLDGVVQFSYSEGLSVILVEALAYGRPLIAAGVGGVNDLIEAEVSGLLVAPGDVAGLAQAMARLAGDPALRQRLSAAARQRFEQLGFTAEQAVARSLEVYDLARRRWSAAQEGMSING